MSNRIDGADNRRENNERTEYPERDPMDLIDEDKRPFVRRRIC